MSELRQAQLPEADALSLPKGWEVKRLRDVCDLQNGYAFKSKSYVEFSNTLNIRMSNIRPDGTFNPEHNIRFLPDSFVDEFQQFLLTEGDLVIAMTDMAGDPKILGLPTMVKNLKGRTFLLNQRVGRLKDFSDEIYIPFLTHYLSSPIIKSYYKSKGAGGLQLNISKKDILTAEIPIPPFEMQKQIVAVLDKAFAAIDLAKANIEKNLQNAKELFQSKLNQIFTQKGDDWEEKKLGEVCVVERGSSPRPIKNFQTDSDDGVNWIKIGDTKNVEKYIYLTKEKITKEGSLKSRFVDVGDFILSNSMSFGRPYIMKTQGYIHDGWFVLRLPNDIDTEFFWYLLVSPYTKNQFESLASGAIVKNISGDLVKKAILPIAPLAEQKQIVQQLDNFSAQTKQLEVQYQQKLDNLDELKKSILQKAFAGKLELK